MDRVERSSVDRASIDKMYALWKKVAESAPLFSEGDIIGMAGGRYLVHCIEEPKVLRTSTSTTDFDNVAILAEINSLYGKKLTSEEFTKAMSIYLRPLEAIPEKVEEDTRLNWTKLNKKRW